MSLILEALKKSEQQRQQKHGAPSKVRRRTLGLPTARASRTPYYWFLAGLVAVVCLAGGWFLSHIQGLTQQPPAVTQAEGPATKVTPSQANQPGPKLPPEAPQLASNSAQTGVPVVSPGPPQPARQGPNQAESRGSSKAAPRKALSVEPAPVPREFVETPFVPPRTAAPAPVKTVRDDRRPTTDRIQPETTASLSPPAPERQPTAPSTAGIREEAGIPLYQDLSDGLRSRLPSLTMSMHFFANDPDRRLVRINGRLLRQGAWLSDNLQLVEITPDGATLDFLGKAFKLRRSAR